jgi:hypothetical protein
METPGIVLLYCYRPVNVIELAKPRVTLYIVFMYK